MQSKTYDYVVIGGGVVGCAVTRELTLKGAAVALVEKARELLDGASKANSAILHTGFDAPPDSIEQKAIELGYAEYLDIYKKLGLPEPQQGALLVARSKDQLDELPKIKEKGSRNGITNIKELTTADIEKLEPNLAKPYYGGLYIKGESIIDPWSAPLAYADMAMQNGAEIMRNSEVLSTRFDGEYWTITTSKGVLKSRYIINCAGLYGDKIDQMITGQKRFNITPRKGQFLVFDKAAASLLNHILLPIPSKVSKGILICKTAFGNILVGPTAVDQQSRTEAIIEPQVQNELYQFAVSAIPQLQNIEITAHYCGLRPATEYQDYQLHFDSDLHYCCVGGIRSTGLTSALGLAKIVSDKLIGEGNPIQNPIWPQANALSIWSKRDFEKSGNKGIVCHCENVTRNEIEAALNHPLKPETLAGLKRLTRVTMGRCQGFYCTGELYKITKNRLQIPIVGGDTSNDE